MKKFIIVAICAFLITVLYFLISPATYKIRNSSPAGKNIVCFGDSLTYGTGASRGMSYPDQLSKMIGTPVINLGIPSDTTAMALKRINDVFEKNPRIVILTLGGNDLKNSVSKEIAFNNLESIINKIQERGALVVIGGIQIPFFGKGYGSAYKILARKTGAVLVPNVYKGILGRPGLMNDRIHPNNAGYKIMAEHFYKALKPYLKSK